MPPALPEPNYAGFPQRVKAPPVCHRAIA
jgi:hypothetical protein